MWFEQVPLSKFEGNRLWVSGAWSGICPGEVKFFSFQGVPFFFSRGPAQHPLGPEVHRFHRFFNAEKLKIFSLELGLNNGSKYGLNSIETNKTYKQTEITTLSITLLVWVSVCLFVLIIKLFAYI